MCLLSYKTRSNSNSVRTRTIKFYRSSHKRRTSPNQIVLNQKGDDLVSFSNSHLQLIFDAFNVGRYEPSALDGCPDGYMQLSELGRPFTGDALYIIQYWKFYLDFNKLTVVFRWILVWIFYRLRCILQWNFNDNSFVETLPCQNERAVQLQIALQIRISNGSHSEVSRWKREKNVYTYVRIGPFISLIPLWELSRPF